MNALRSLAVGFGSRPAWRALDSLTGHALIREGLFVAARTLVDRWEPSVQTELNDVFLKKLALFLDRDEIITWRELQSSFAEVNYLQWTVPLRVAVQAPHVHNLLGVGWQHRNLSPNHLGLELLRVGNSLIAEGSFDAGLAALTGAAHRELAGLAAITAIQHVVSRLTPRKARIPERPIVDEFGHRLGDLAVWLADTGHHGAAVHAILLTPLMAGNLDAFQDFGRRILLSSPDPLLGPVQQPIELCLELHRAGYRTQAVELLAAATGVAESDKFQWRRQYENIADHYANFRELHGIGGRGGSGVLAAAGRSLAKFAAPDVFGAAKEISIPLDLGPKPATAVPSEKEAAPAESSVFPKRNVNAWIEEPDGAPRDEFDVCVNIGPDRPGAMGGPFAEPDWGKRDYVDLRVTVSGFGAKVRPAWRTLRLARVGKSEEVRFRIKSSLSGMLTLYVRILLADEMLLIDEHKLTIETEPERQAA
jgi:hypothetical protein